MSSPQGRLTQASGPLKDRCLGKRLHPQSEGEMLGSARHLWAP